MIIYPDGTALIAERSIVRYTMYAITIERNTLGSVGITLLPKTGDDINAVDILIKIRITIIKSIIPNIVILPV
jgi:hypothetical protein